MAVLAHAYNSERHCSLEDSLLGWPGLPCACFTVDFFLFSILFHHFFHRFWSFMNILYRILYMVSASGNYNLQQLVISSRKSFNPQLSFLPQWSLSKLIIFHSRFIEIQLPECITKILQIKYNLFIYLFIYFWYLSIFIQNISKIIKQKITKQIITFMRQLDIWTHTGHLMIITF